MKKSVFVALCRSSEGFDEPLFGSFDEEECKKELRVFCEANADDKFWLIDSARVERVKFYFNGEEKDKGVDKA